MLLGVIVRIISFIMQVFVGIMSSVEDGVPMLDLIAKDAWFDPKTMMIIFVLDLVLNLLHIVTGSIAGVKGAKYWTVPVEAPGVIKWGVIALIVAIANIVLSVIIGGTSVIAIIRGCLFQVLYLIGALQLKRCAG